jgi:hypothetical protein
MSIVLFGRILFFCLSVFTHSVSIENLSHHRNARNMRDQMKMVENGTKLDVGLSHAYFLSKKYFGLKKMNARILNFVGRKIHSHFLPII